MAGGADRIKLFKFIRKTYQDIGLYPPESNKNHSPMNSKIWFNLFCLVEFFISTTAYLVFEANSMIEYGMVFYTFTAAILSFILNLILIFQMKNILSYIERCERFIEKRTDSRIVYNDVNEKIERLTESYAYALTATATFFMLPPLFYAIVSYYFLGSGTASFVFYFPTWWPFDWKAPFGYLVAWLAQSVGVAAIVIHFISFFNLIFGSSWIFLVIAEDITYDMTSFKNIINSLKEDRNDQAELIKRFFNLIQLYSDAKRCVADFNRVCEYSLFTIFSWTMLCISSLLVALQFQLSDDDSELFVIIILSIAIQWVLALNLATCECGQRVTDQFEQFGVEFGRCEWNKLSQKMQRIYLIFLSDTQQPKNIRSYGGVVCTRETFKNVIVQPNDII